MSARPPLLAPRIVASLLTGHPYADAVLGDLEEEFARVASERGPVAARRWYWRQVARSSPSLIGLVRLDGRISLHLAAVAVPAYAGALALLRIASPAIAHTISPGGLRFHVVYGVAVFAAGALAGCATARWTAPRGTAGALLLLAVTLAVGGIHAAGGAPAERGFRLVKVLLLAFAVCAGALHAARPRSVRPT